ncbi:MAG TPA: type II toxin-antitoxin system VapC family toxin [Solirubrobacterales bacterium]|jgi:predicted nucleic acid-binding protein|nr:type II toxin-antitoxin system VapC family toxin [Solirubrobacterales bacterium]
MGDGGDLAYVDTSAFLKLLGSEPESALVVEAIDSTWPHLVASEILAVESFRAALLLGGEAPAEVTRLLNLVALQPLSREIRDSACRIAPPRLRTLDAIHLATAISLDRRIGAIFTYDKRLAEASADAGLQVLAPA